MIAPSAAIEFNEAPAADCAEAAARIAASLRSGKLFKFLATSFFLVSSGG
jgi:hypothetical protein